MPYYPSIDQDLARAKEILKKGDHRAELEHELASGGLRHFSDEAKDEIRERHGGTIYGGDIYAAYKLLESFVAHIEYCHQQVEACHVHIEKLERFKKHATTLNKKAAAEIERLRLPGPLTGLQHAKYLNPACGESGCQWLTAQEEIRLLNVQVRRYQHAIEEMEKK